MADQQFGLAGVMGWPVAHSRSPIIHNHWLEQYGLNGRYVQLATQPNKLNAAINGLAALGFRGCNVTIPHKVNVLPLMQVLDPVAMQMGAVNTIVVQPDGSLKGMNTDGYGFIQSLLDAKPGWTASSGPITVLGAGGAARAIALSLAQHGATEIRLVNRTVENAQQLATEFGGPIKAYAWADRHRAIEGVSLLVNSTNQGMHGQPALDLDLALLPRSALVCDAVYVPLETPLLSAARRRGNTVVDGLGMLLNQARPAFNAWFGVMPTISPALRKVIEATL